MQVYCGRRGTGLLFLHKNHQQISNDIRYSIIIPHYNQVEALERCLCALEEQSTPIEKYEIIVVDNGSEGIDKLYQMFPFVRWISNQESLNPYVSRNIGVKESVGDIICFLDASCIPSNDWISAGAYCVETYDANIIAGSFKLTTESRSLFDNVHGLLYLNNKKNVENGFGIPAGNLFVARKVFGKIGHFKTYSNSGMDIEWSRRADAVFETKYCANAVVSYRAKSYNQLKSDIKKYAHGVVMIAATTGRKERVLYSFLPMRPSNFSNAITYRGHNDLSWISKFQLYIGVWSIKVHYGWALLTAKYLH